MSDLRFIEFRDMPLDEVELGSRARPVTDVGVAAILAGTEEGGAITDPIDVRRVRRGGEMHFVIIDGGHRLEAARRLGQVTVRALIYEGTEVDARLMEIERNIARAEMKPIDRAVFLMRYKDAYEEKHPEAKKAIGAALAAKRWDATGTMPVVSFAAALGQQLNQNETTIRRQIAAAKNLSVAEIEALRAAPNWVDFKDLSEIGKIGEADERAFVVSQFADGTAKKASAARRAFAARQGKSAPVKSPVEASLQRLLDAWDRAPKEARRRFVTSRREALDELLGETLFDGGDADA